MNLQTTVVNDSLTVSLATAFATRQTNIYWSRMVEGNRQGGSSRDPFIVRFCFRVARSVIPWSVSRPSVTDSYDASLPPLFERWSMRGMLLARPFDRSTECVCKLVRMQQHGFLDKRKKETGGGGEVRNKNKDESQNFYDRVFTELGDVTLQ